MASGSDIGRSYTKMLAITTGTDTQLCLQEGEEATNRCASNSEPARDKQPSLLEMLSLSAWRKFSVETVGLLVVLAVLQHWVFQGTEIQGLPHPYWLPVLLVSSQYGVGGGAFAAVAASALYYSALPAQSAAEGFYEYARVVACQPAIWFGTALVIGGLRSLYIQQYLALAERLSLSCRSAAEISAALERASGEIHALERRIAADRSTIAAFSRSLSMIDLSSSVRVAETFGSIFCVATGLTNFTIYLRTIDEFTPAVQFEGSHQVECAKEAQNIISMEAMAESSKVLTQGDGGARADRYVVLISAESSSEMFGAIDCQINSGICVKQFRRRAEQLCCAFGKLLRAVQIPREQAL